MMRKTDEDFLRRRTLELRPDELILLLERWAVSLEVGKSWAEILGEEITVAHRAEGKHAREAYLLSGKRSQAATIFLTDLYELMIARGNSLSEAARCYPRIFDAQLLAVIKAGDNSAGYSKGFRWYAKSLKDRLDTKRKTISKFIYPAFLLTACIGVVVVFGFFVIPAYKLLFAGEQLGDLPTMTKLVFRLSDFCLANWFWIGVAPTAGALGYGRLRRRHAIRFKEDEYVLKTPMLGDLIAQLDVYGYFSIFSALIAAGVPSFDAAELAAEVFRNRPLRKAALDAAREAKAVGGFLHEKLAERHPVFSPASSFYSIMRTFEKSTGDVEHIAPYCEELRLKAEETRERLLAVIQPTLIAIMSVVVGFMVLALYLPLFEAIGRLAMPR